VRPKVELVEVETEDGLINAGALLEPTGGSPGALGVDVALLLHGSAMNFYHPFLRFFAEGLAAHGCATLRANNRGHDMISRAVGRLDRVSALESIPEGAPDPLFGTACERFDDCRLDWRAWVGFLSGRGYRRILLWGHSRGAVKTCHYMSQERDPRVAACVLASPPRYAHDRWMRSDQAGRFAEDLRAARALVAAGRPDELLRVRIPMDYYVAAAQYLDQYGPEQRYDVFRMVDRVPCPVLVLTGTLEVAERFGFDGLPEDFAAMRARKPDLTHVSIPGGDHLYTGREETAVAAVLDWLRAGGARA
jgi:pimeloyl-ACP methyl ester carboxylesterase